MQLHHFALALAPLAAPLCAQSASSAGYFLVDGEVGPGGAAQSIVHQLHGTCSSGAPAARAASTGFVLLGGFPAAIEAPVAGRPWLCGVTPGDAPLLGGTALTLHGTELNLGAVPAITIGGVAAQAGARTNATIQVTLPALPRPGYQRVEVQNSLGTSTLPAGLGVMPLLDVPVARQALVPAALRYRGALADQVVFVLALGTFPFPIALPPFHHGLELDLASLLVLPAMGVGDPGGVLRLDLPGVASSIPIFFQAFTLTQNPGWFPGSFTNVTRM
jgi:hypothetical protein